MESLAPFGDYHQPMTLDPRDMRHDRARESRTTLPSTRLAPTRAILLAALAALGCSDGESVGPVHELTTTAIDLLPKLAPRRGPSGAVHAARHADRGLFGDDWYAIETGGDFAWARGKRAELRLLVAEPEAVRTLIVEVQPPAFLGEQVLEAFVGETSVGRRTLEAGWQTVRFEVTAEQVTSGFNDVVLVAEVDGTAAEHGAGGDLRRLAFGCGRIAFDSTVGTATAMLQGPTPLVEDRVGIGPIESPRSAVLAAGESLWCPLAVEAETPGRFQLVLKTEGSARVLVRMVGRKNGAVLYHQEHEFTNQAELDVDLNAAAGTRLLISLSTLTQSEPVQITRAALVTPRPFTNVIVVIIDTLRADHVIGSTRTQTPNIDAFAARAIPFASAFSHANITLPSHTALFSSRLPWETGVVLNGVPVQRGLPLFADWLGELGYETRAVVSMGSLWPVTPLGGIDRGFSTFDGRVRDDMSAYWANERLDPVLDEVVALDARGAPFFLFVHYSDPHRPMLAHGTAKKDADVRLNGVTVDTLSMPDTVGWRKSVVLRPGTNELTITADSPFTWSRVNVEGPNGPLEVDAADAPLGGSTQLTATVSNPREQPVEVIVSIRVREELSHEEFRQRYAAEVGHVDGGFGALMDELEQRGLFDDTLILFTSDHGQGLWDHNAGRSRNELVRRTDSRSARHQAAAWSPGHRCVACLAGRTRATC